MENWEIDFNWLKVRHFVKDAFNASELPNLETILFLIGMQELGIAVTELSKKRKLEITTLGICKVLSLEAYFEKSGYDDEGWPVWKELKPFKPANDTEKEKILKQLTIKYFEDEYEV